MTLDLNPGTVCAANGRVLQIDGPDSLTHIRAREIATGNMVTVAISQIEALPKTANTLTTSCIPEKEWKRCVALVKDLSPLIESAFVSRQEWENLSKRHSLSVRQLQRNLADFRKDPRTSTLARQKGGRPIGLSLLNPKVDKLIRYCITKYYMRREKPPKEYVVVRSISLARRMSLPSPSRKAILLRLNQEIGWLSDLNRQGRRASKQKWDVRTGHLHVTQPLELVQIDHTPADVMILSDDRLTVLGRPWVTVAIDVATRCVLGLYSSMDPPSAVSVSLCIEHAVLPKRENENDPGLWPMYGKPWKILVDNGKDFRSMALQRGCDEHGITLSWRPVKTPHYGAHIERLIGTLMGIAHLLPGTTFSNIQQRGDYDSAGKARLTMDEFREWMTQKVCRFYHQRPHRSLGNAPVLAWERGLCDESGRLISPPLIARPLDFRMDFLPYVTRIIRRTGIEFNRSFYWHEDLAPMLNLGSGSIVRYDPRMPGTVWVRRADGLLVTVPVTGGRAAGDTPIKIVVDKDSRAKLDYEIDKGFANTDAIEAEAERATRKARRSKSRLLRPSSSSKLNPTTTGKTLPTAAPSRSSIRLEEWE